MMKSTHRDGHVVSQSKSDVEENDEDISGCSICFDSIREVSFLEQ